MPSQTLGKCNLKFSTKFSKNRNFQNFLKMSKFSLKTHSLKALGFRKSFFGRSCALEINKWCEALFPDGQRAKIGGCHQYMSKSLQKMTFFKIFQFHMKVLWKLLMELAKKWPEILVKWPSPSFVIFVWKQSL